MEISVLICTTTGLSSRARRGLRTLSTAQSLLPADRLAHEADADSQLLAHLAARALVADLAAVPLDLVTLERRCPQCGSSAHGVPSASGPFARRFLSISHTRGFAAVAVSATTPIGIDAEAGGDAALWTSAADTLFSAQEREAVFGDASGLAGRRLWARKEAIAKLHGLGVTLDLQALDVSATSETWAQTPYGCVTSLPAPREVAVALAAPGPTSVSVREMLAATDLVALATSIGRTATSAESGPVARGRSPESAASGYPGSTAPR